MKYNECDPLTLDSNLYGVVVNVSDNYIKVSEFELQSRYYVHIQTNTLVKGLNLIIPHLAIG